MNQDWTDKEIEILKEFYPTLHKPLEITKMIHRSYSSIRTKATNLKIYREFQCGPWDKKREAELVRLYPNIRNVDIAKKLGVTESAVIARAYKMRLRKDPAFLYECSAKGFYKKGREPINKGRKQSEWMSKDKIKKTAATRFKRGNTPINYKTVGSERLDVDGYLEVKIADPNKWAYKHRQIWIENFGEIPKGMLVKFKDGNKLNMDPANLYLTTRQENMQTNTYHNYPKEIANLIQLKGALNRQINKYEKHK